jgi:hypothetical protein
VVLKRDHRPLLLFEDRRGAPRGGGLGRGSRKRPAEPASKSHDELLVLQQATQVDLKRYEDRLRIATSALAEHDEQAG